jgi:hypothetical protein
MSQVGPVLQALVRSLRGEFRAAAGLDPASLAAARRAAAAYLRMRDVTNPRGRWQSLGIYQQIAGQRRLPRTRFPQLLDLRAEPLDEAAYAELLRPSEEPLTHVRQLRRALAGRPQAALPRIHLAGRYTEAGLFGTAERLLLDALRCSPSPEERGSIFLGLARARLGMDLYPEALRALGQAREVGVDRTQLEAFSPILGREPAFQELLAR